MKKLFQKIKNLKYFFMALRATQDLLISSQFKRDIANAKNPLNKFGKRCYSQTDEDGITIEIVKRLNIKKGIFCEIGSDTGLQNNTLILAAMGWSGIWIDALDLAIDHKKLKRLKFIKEFLTLDNIVSCIKKGQDSFEKKVIDVMSLDVDSNDYYFSEELLKKGILPKVFIVEINQKFPPPVEFVVDYDPNFSHQHDYHGASLTSFTKMFAKYEYSPICCTLTMGHNAFFIQNQYLDLFKDVPKELESIYNIPSYWSYTHNFGSVSIKTIEKIFKD
jgi:hypothetical protein